mgnify:CR=1 FL=1
MRHSLTRRQAEALAFIRLYLKEKGQPPAYLDIARGLGLASTAPAYALVDRLEERGYITRLRGRARSITMVSPDRDEISDLRVIRDAANAYISLQERFRAGYDSGQSPEESKAMGGRVAAALDGLRSLVRGGPR